MSPGPEIRTLVLTKDNALTTAFGEIALEFGISAQSSGNKNGGIPEELGTTKYEGLCMDFDTRQQPLVILAHVRQNPINKNTVIFAVVGSAEARQRAREQGAMFVLERPLKSDDLRRVLQVAYGLMTRERRRYFRCAAEIPAKLVRDSGEELICKTINISSNGMALSSPRPLEAGEKLHISMTLPESNAAIRLEGTVVWDDKHGKTGLGLQCANSQMQRELDAWLDSHFGRAIGKAV